MVIGHPGGLVFKTPKTFNLKNVKFLAEAPGEVPPHHMYERKLTIKKSLSKKYILTTKFKL